GVWGVGGGGAGSAGPPSPPSRARRPRTPAPGRPAPAETPPLTPGEEEVVSSSLHGRLVGGFLWNLGSSGVSQISRIAIGVLLARLLTPSDYGIAGMALVFSSLVLYLSDFSMGSALVQRKNITEEDRSTVFWT